MIALGVFVSLPTTPTFVGRQPGTSRTTTYHHSLRMNAFAVHDLLVFLLSVQFS